MSLVVVDTDIGSFYFKKDSRARLYRHHLIGRAPVISFMTLAELLAWAQERRWGLGRQAALARHLTCAAYGLEANGMLSSSIASSGKRNASILTTTSSPARRSSPRQRSGRAVTPQPEPEVVHSK